MGGDGRGSVSGLQFSFKPIKVSLVDGVGWVGISIWTSISKVANPLRALRSKSQKNRIPKSQRSLKKDPKTSGAARRQAANAAKITIPSTPSAPSTPKITGSGSRFLCGRVPLAYPPFFHVLSEMLRRPWWWSMLLRSWWPVYDGYVGCRKGDAGAIN
ncbi:hypothetical protein TorRG33x02_285280 [Trema orientale]|uniref:Uncharacterized protein n=1 Tax=Trema orientale TaxID=63057 RepID=A0A2P5CGN1_TREOI|nr:hypothetical protein TorRG33x02_285280 [Trema orientale]